MKSAWMRIHGSTLAQAAAYDEEAGIIYVLTHQGVEWAIPSCEPQDWQDLLSPSISKGAFIMGLLQRNQRIANAQSQESSAEVSERDGNASPMRPEVGNAEHSPTREHSHHMTALTKPVAENTVTRATDDRAYEGNNQLTPIAALPLFDAEGSGTLDLRNSDELNLASFEGRTDVEVLLLDGATAVESFEPLANFPNLRILSLQNLGLRKIPEPVFRIARLEVLDLSGNKLRSLGRRRKTGDELARATSRIKMPWLDDEQVSFANLRGLHTLRAAECGLTSVTEDIGQLINLQVLNLSSNELTALPAELGQCTQLRELDISRNFQLSPPPSLQHMRRLMALDLSHNSLSSLRPEFSAVNPDALLRLQGNWFPETLYDLIDRGNRELFAYLRTLGRDAVENLDAKVILVGEGNVGKTSMVAALTANAFVENRATTHGIEITDIPVPYPKVRGRAIKLRTWDFGGQEVYRITHQFFFTGAALYVLVWRPREGQHENAVASWLERIQLRAGRDVRVLLVSTHAEERAAELDIATLRQRFGKMIAGSLEVDSRTLKGYPELVEQLALEAMRLPQVGQKISKRWLDVIRDTASLDAASIDMDAFSAACQVRGVEPWERDSLLAYMNDLGHIIHFPDDDGLRNSIVLQPEWLSTAIGLVLEDRLTRTHAGRLEHTRLKEIWGEGEHSDHLLNHQAFFLRLMEKFDVSYRIPDSDESLVAQLVPHERPVLSDWRRGFPEIRVRFTMEDPPPGLIPWLIVRNHRYSTGQHWRSGVLLRHPVYGSQGLLESSRGGLMLTVRGEEPVLLFNVLRDTVELLLRERWPGLAYQMLVPCGELLEDGATCPGYFPIGALERFRAAGQAEIHCHQCVRVKSVVQLLMGVGVETRGLDELLDAVGSLSGLMERTASDVRFVRRAISHEISDVPSLFQLVAPDHDAWLRHPFERPLRLMLWCEEPSKQHLSAHEGYEFQESREWFRRAAPYLVIVSKLLRGALPIAGNALEVFGPGELSDIKERLDLTESIVKAIDLPVATPEQQSVGSLTAAEGAALRAFRELLLRIDPSRSFAGLRRVFSPAGDVLWVCSDHYRLYDPGLPSIE